MLHQLEIRSLVLGVHLGCEAEERRIQQNVAFSVAFRFRSMPEGCKTDELKDSICYAKVSEAIEETVASPREFKLIEHLAYVIFERLKKLSGDQAAIKLQVHKLHPPVEKLEGGSVYVMGDFE